MHYGLPCVLTAVHPDVKPGHRWIQLHNFFAPLINQRVDGIDFRLVEIEVCIGVSFRNEKRVQLRYRVSVEVSVCEFVLCDDLGVRRFTKQTPSLALGVAFHNIPEVFIITITLGRIARVTKRLKIRDIILPTKTTGKDVVYFQCLWSADVPQSWQRISNCLKSRAAPLLLVRAMSRRTGRRPVLPPNGSWPKETASSTFVSVLQLPIRSVGRRADKSLVIYLLRA
jgi:hypothetical protein